MTNPVSEEPVAFRFRWKSEGRGIHWDGYSPFIDDAEILKSQGAEVEFLYLHPTNTIRDKAIDRICAGAVSLIEEQAKVIDDLMVALRPFSDWGKDYADEDGDYLLLGSDRNSASESDLRRAVHVFSKAILSINGGNHEQG